MEEQKKLERQEKRRYEKPQVTSIEIDPLAESLMLLATYYVNTGCAGSCYPGSGLCS